MSNQADLAALFDQLVEIEDLEARCKLLRNTTTDDPELRTELESLLAAHDAAGDFLEEPVLEEAAVLIPEVLGSNLIGTFVGSWRVDALIDAGGMGSVFRATRIEDAFSQPGALKLVRVGFETEELVRRFGRERQMLAGLEHPHIARLLDGGATAEGLPWLAMEYVDGMPIDAYADHHRLTLSQRLDLFDQLADAIAYLHQKLITHRDIKLANVLVDGSGHVRVLDFGIASLLDDASAMGDLTVERRLSFATASPEQLRGDSVSTATDIYALGVLLYRLLAGVPPYRITGDMSAAQIEDLICEQVPPPASIALSQSEEAGTISEQRHSSLRALVAELSGDLDTILAKALHKAPERRYGSVAELRADIERYREHRPILARPDSATYRTEKFVRRHWRGLSATVAAILALAIGLGVALWQADEARRQRDRAQAMNDFMQEVLAEADPYAAGEDRTVREVLVDAGELLDQRFADQPLLEASLRTSVGAVQLSMLELKAGEANLDRALALMDGRVSDDHQERLEAEANLAWALYEREDYAGAEARYQSIRERFNEQHAAELRATVHNDMGMVLAEQEKYEDSIVLLLEAMRIQPVSPSRIATLINIGYAYDGLGELEEAREYYEEAIERLRALGERGVVADLANALNNYGNILSQQDRDDEALPLYLEALEVNYQVFGQNSDAVAMQQLNLGRLLLDMNRASDARLYLEKSLVTFPLFREPDSIFVLVTRASHARAVWLTANDSFERDEAVSTLGEVLEMMKLNDQIRVSRFVPQTEDWLKQAGAGGMP